MQFSIYVRHRCGLRTDLKISNDKWDDSSSFWLRRNSVVCSGLDFVESISRVGHNLSANPNGNKKPFCGISM